MSYLLFDIIGDLEDWFFGLFFLLDCAVLKLLNGIYNCFGVFVGLTKVKVDGTSYKYLIDVFFGNSTIAIVYKGMALIGIALAFAFAILNVVRKIFDTNDKVKTTLGGIVGNLIKSIVLILLMNAIIIGVLNCTNVLMQQITYLFDHADEINENIKNNKTFKPEEYAAMARVLDKIGNYSLNPSRDSRYNINSCYNDIRRDMLILQDRRVFEFSYEDYTINGSNVVYADYTTPTWQYVLAKIAKAHDLSEEQPIDEYDENIYNAISEAMVIIETMDNFKPLEKYSNPRVSLKGSDNSLRIDTIVFLAGTMDCAHNDYYNRNAGMYDAIRADYMNGSKSVYSYDTVKGDFDVYNMGCHFLIIIVGLILIQEFLKIAMNCVSRIFNMVLLYLAFPPFAATMAFDDGAKVKQWTVAFVVQSFSVLGTVISIRLLLLFVPIVFNSNLELFETSIYNMTAKIIFLIAVSYTIEKAGNIITGILADQAGFQSVTAGSAGSAAAKSTIGSAVSLGRKGAGIASKYGGKAASMAGKAGSALWDRTGGRAMDKAGAAMNRKMKDDKSKVGAGLRAAQSAGNSLREMGNTIKQAAHNWLGEGASEHRQKAAQQDQARENLMDYLHSKNDDLKNNAREHVAQMSGDEAKEKYGMSNDQLNNLRESEGIQRASGSGSSTRGLGGAGMVYHGPRDGGQANNNAQGGQGGQGSPQGGQANNNAQGGQGGQGGSQGGVAKTPPQRNAGGISPQPTNHNSRN